MRNLTSVSQKITPVDFHTADAHAGMGRFQQARRDGPARVMGDPRIARGAPISAADAIAAFNRQRASGPDDFGERANAYRQRWGFEQQAGSREAQSALSNAPQARLHEGGWQDRRAYGDGAKQPAKRRFIGGLAGARQRTQRAILLAASTLCAASHRRRTRLQGLTLPTSSPLRR